MWVNSTYNVCRMYYRMKREECICPYDEVITDVDLGDSLLYTCFSLSLQLNIRQSHSNLSGEQPVGTLI